MEYLDFVHKTTEKMLVDDSTGTVNVYGGPFGQTAAPAVPETPIFMDSAVLISIFFLGLSGTGHCIGMCGPLVIAFPATTGRLSAHLCYHAGRISTYALAGALMGSLGLVAAKVASATGADYLTMAARTQVVFSLLAGSFLLMFGLSQLGITREPAWLSVAMLGRIPGYTTVVRSVLGKNSRLLMYITGMLMGLLPCGLSFAAFSRALALGGPFEGGLLLLVFGCGTLPGLLLIGTGASALARRYRKHFDLFSGMLMIAMAAALMVDAIGAMFN